MKKFIDKPLEAVTQRFPQFSIASTSFLWGIALMFPYSTYETSTGYELLGNFATEFVAGTVVAVLGALNLHALTIENWWLHRKTAIGLMLFWCLVTVVFFTSAPASASWVLLAGLAWMHGWSAVIGEHACNPYEY